MIKKETPFEAGIVLSRNEVTGKPSSHSNKQAQTQFGINDGCSVRGLSTGEQIKEGI